MSVAAKIAVFAGAGVLAVGGAGLYAGALSVTGPGATTGSGSVNLTAACKDDVTMVPGPAYYNADDQISEYTTLTLSSDTNFTACAGQEVTIIVFANKAVTAGDSPSYGYTSGRLSRALRRIFQCRHQSRPCGFDVPAHTRQLRHAS